VVGLSVGYRIPSQIMDLADKVMHVATPGLRSPRSVRDGDEVPLIIPVATNDELLATAARRAAELVKREDAGRAAIICPDDLVNDMSADQGLSIVPASLAKGLELDDVIVVEPTAIVADDAQGLRLLYVTLTRSTRSLTVVHALPLPNAML
jgi:DNA helicase IV